MPFRPDSQPIVCPLTLALGLLLCGPAAAADWPLWRHDANRSATSPQELAAALQLQWVHEYAALKPAWPDQPKMQLDAAYEPVVLGKTLFVGSSREDCLIALDTATGAEKWRVLADGPVRFAPAAWQGKVYFASDDGHLYCVEAQSGRLLWKFRGGPNDRRLLGNGRLISTWPARGAPVVADGTVYFAASIWPFMGVFIHALDAETGRVVWTNDGDGSTYMKQPHNTDAFAGVAPQGPMMVIGDRLLIPGGRSVPACYDRKTGKMLVYKLAENGKKGGGSDVAAVGKVFFNGGAAFDLATQKHLGEFGQALALTEKTIYTYQRAALRAFDLVGAGESADAASRERERPEEGQTPDKKDEPVKTTKWTAHETASCQLPGVEVLIKAGSRLYAGGARKVWAVELSASKAKPSAITWEADVPGTVVRLLAADDRLFAVTLEGGIYCFGADATEPKRQMLTTAAVEPSKTWAPAVGPMLKGVNVHSGYCVVWGAGSGELIAEVVRQSNLYVIVVEPVEAKARGLRDKLTAAGLYGERVAVHVGDPISFQLPPYMAGLMVSENLQAAGVPLGAEWLRNAFQVLRPYGGTACFWLSPGQRQLLPKLVSEAGLAGAKVRETDGLTMLSREGPLPGAANWTHEHADAANTRVSKDKLVKAPLGLLWFGGTSNEGVLPRHGHGPQPQVIDGRMIIEGVDMLRAIDIYTGRLLWEAPLPGLGRFYNNVFHQPGANASGTNFISTPDGIYVAYDKVCLRLDPETGKRLAEFQLPALPELKGAPRWGYLNVVGPYLVGSAEPLLDPKLLPTDPKLLAPGDGEDRSVNKTDLLTKVLKTIKSSNDNLSSSRHLIVLDRHSGKVLWTAAARYGFRHNATCAGGGRLYTIDRMSGLQLARLKHRGEELAVKARLIAFDLQSGKELWSSDEDVFGTWLSYSEKHDVLVEAGRVARDTIVDEPKGMRTYKAATGQVLWFEPAFIGPAMIHGDTILKDSSACDLLTGAPKLREDPLTGAQVPWTWARNYGCNTPAASEHLLTFRSGAAGYLDYCNDGGTGNFGGFRSSCTNNLIVAGGVLTAPDYTRTCVCRYQNQTSVGLIHMPEAEMWTSFGVGGTGGPVRRVGISLGAPGDRRAENGTLWLEYPSVGGKSPAVPVQVKGAKVEWFRHHSSRVAGPMNWVAASGVQGLESIAISLGKGGKKGRLYTVRLYFVEPDGLEAGQRRFSVAVQGQEVLRDLDIAKEAGGANRALMKEFRGVRVMDELVVRFTPSVGTARVMPVLCGVEVVVEQQ